MTVLQFNTTRTVATANLGTEQAQAHFADLQIFTKTLLAAANDNKALADNAGLNQKYIDKVLKNTNCSHHGYESWTQYINNKQLQEDNPSFFGELDGNQLTQNIRDRKANMALIEQVRAKATKLSVKRTTDTTEDFTLYQDEYGLMLDSTAYFNGEEKAMINYDIQEGVKPVICIAVSIGANGSFEEYHFINRGAALINLVHELERAGVSVGIVGYSTTRDMKGYTVVIKQPNQAIDETTLVNTLCQYEFLRSIDFAMDALIKNVRVGRMSVTIDKDILANTLAQVDKDNIVLVPYDSASNYGTPEQAQEHILNIVKENNPDILA